MKSYLLQSYLGLPAVMAQLVMAAFVIVGLLTEPSLILYSGIAVVLGVLILRQPLIGLLVIISTTMIFERFFTLQSLIIDRATYKLYPLDIIIGLTLVSLVIAALRERQYLRLRWELPEKALALFIVFASYHFLLDFFDPTSLVPVAFSTFKNYAFYPLLYFVTLLVVRDRRDLSAVITTIMGAGLIIIGFIVAGTIRGEGYWTEFTPLSTEGSRLLAGTHAFYLILALMFLLAGIAYGRVRSLTSAGAVMVIWGFGILGSLMRHLWIAGLAGCLTLVMIMPMVGRRRLIAMLARTGVVALALGACLVWAALLDPSASFDTSANTIIAAAQQRATSLSSLASDTSANWRLVLWRDAFEAWRLHPIAGIGFGKTIDLDFGDWQTTEEIRNLHNSPLAILIQMGVVGASLFALWYLSVLWSSWRHAPRDSVSTALIAGAIVIIVSSLFQPYFETNLTAIFLWITLALLRRTSELDRAGV